MQNNKGYFLIEVILSITIGSLVISGIFTYMRVLLDRATKETNRAEQYLNNIKDNSAGFISIPIIVTISILLLILSTYSVIINSVAEEDSGHNCRDTATASAEFCIKRAEMNYREGVQNIPAVLYSEPSLICEINSVNEGKDLLGKAFENIKVIGRQKTNRCSITGFATITVTTLDMKILN
ncbi:MAG: hypothetical protein NTV72_00750 [Candidatus Taylorbacteria bacterium]|nr:hypothetical protein [Candidatus Taylorbacteria bacterium]